MKVKKVDGQSTNILMLSTVLSIFAQQKCANQIQDRFYDSHFLAELHFFLVEKAYILYKLQDLLDPEDQHKPQR